MSRAITAIFTLFLCRKMLSFALSLILSTHTRTHTHTHTHTHTAWSILSLHDPALRSFFILLSLPRLSPQPELNAHSRNSPVLFKVALLCCVGTEECINK